MLMVIPNAGKQFWLNRFIGGLSEPSEIRLFKNNYTPVDGSVLADFTEADFDNYEAVPISYSNFPAPSIVDNVAVVEADFIPTFICEAGPAQTVYGWYLVNASDVVVAAQRFDTPRVMDESVTEKLDPFQFKFKTYAE